MTITPIRNHILFRFLDEVDGKGQFTRTTTSGIFVAGHHDPSAKEPRWATVIAIGPEVSTSLSETICLGCEILIDNLRWTEGVVVDGRKLWRTDETQILATRAAPARAWAGQTHSQ